jgi:hypothetical protein
LFLQSRNESLRQHDRPILAALSLSDNDRAAAKVNILHPKLQAFIDPHPRSIKQLCEQPVFSLQETENPGDFIG